MISPHSRILITGADGFVGWHVLQQLQKSGYQDLHVTTYSSSERLKAACGAENVHQLDLTDTSAVLECVRELQPAAILHFAAWSAVGSSFDNASKVMNMNTALQLSVLEAIRQAAPQARLLCIGSAHGYGHISADLNPHQITEEYPLNPDNPYAVSKITQEMLSRAYKFAYGLDIVFVRPFNQIGPGQLNEFAVPSFAEQIAAVERGEQSVVQVGNLDAVRDFTDVRDAAVAYQILLESGISGETYNLGSGVGNTMEAVLNILRGLAETEVRVEVDPSRLRPSDIPVFVADATRLRALGWQPSYSLEDTLHDILKDIRSKKKHE